MRKNLNVSFSYVNNAYIARHASRVNTMFMHETYKKLLEILASKNLSVADLARELDTTDQRIQNWKNRGIAYQMLPVIANRLNIDVSVLTGLAPSQRKAIQENTKKNETYVLELLNVSASMGDGYAPPSHIETIEKMTVKAEWFHQNVNATSPYNVALITARGDSMAPIFTDGDVLLVDRGVREIDLDAIYVLSLEGDIYIKRIQRAPKEIIIVSENRAYEPIRVPKKDKDRLFVHGRVLFAWNGTRL